ncbi:DNA topoisomerase III [Klebsiella pneumoniae]|uniref:DNA topoisomerase n=1 Tax=Klebsiella pneumoniae TaxID=573 RepID=UPI000CD5B46E|nr:DNA topoisomerase [Klebsiella pneumoniae]POJ46723.1 DNA topoisomerase III [Klebsiella pneumoniae]POJ68061.1 DNA topoisomerase III [Klebsiella pneumoniae]POL11730.1 DNA topoisomerase III [Klebsiella pneumoniae]POL28599.1 DNA topoisomerase III [Klebsiella pneumoniae]
MSKKNKLLSVLSDAEQEALYGLPEFDDAQQLEYLAVTETELALANSRPSLHAKVYCLLQIGYFKAKHAFFSFDWDEVEDDCAFVLSRYFHGEVFEPKAITKHERYTQREQIAKLFGYWPWSAAFLPQLEQQAARTVRRDVTPGFVAAELIVWLNEHKIIRPGYTTFGLVNMRTLANQNHTESFYYDVFASLSMNGHQIKAKYQTTDDDQIDEKKRLISEAQAAHIAGRVTGKDAIVTIATTKPENSKPPLPLNLSTLQQLCAKRFGYSAKDTLDVMQGLYETHKLLTYPRSDNRYLSDEHYYQAGDIATAIAATVPELASAIVDMDKGQKHKAFNASKIEAHHAIIPTTKSGAGIQLNEKERNVYNLVSVYFIGLFYPDAIRNKTKIHFDIKGDTFTATQSVLVQKGWEALGKDSDDEDETEDAGTDGFDLSLLKFNDSGLCESADVDKKKTTPPRYFTESTLLAAMTSAAKFIDDPALRKALEAKDEGSSDRGSIGTEATRAGILEKLAANTGLISIEKEKGYSELVWKTTKQGQEFCAALPPEITKPDISALWAEKQSQIKAGELTVEEFIKENDEYVQGLIDELDRNGISISSNATPCPVCNNGFLRKRKGQNGFFWGCSCYPECKTTFPDKDGKPDMEAKSRSEGSMSRLEAPCPSCSKEIIIRPKGFFCSGCEFKIWSEVSGKKLTQNQVETLIKKGKTGEIKGFTSNKTGKKFDAAIVLQDKTTGKLGFQFSKK